jgi:hypothetical protein
MELVNRFLSFDKLMGATLVRIVYYLGIVGILLGVIAQVFASFGAMRYSFGSGLGLLIAAPVLGLVGICFWRFVCELYLVMFRIGEDVAALRAQGGMSGSGATGSTGTGSTGTT